MDQLGAALISCLGYQLILLQHRAESPVVEDKVVEHTDSGQFPCYTCRWVTIRSPVLGSRSPVR